MSAMQFETLHVLPNILRITPIIAYAIAVSLIQVDAASVDTKPAPQATLEALRRDFTMTEVLSLISVSTSRSSSKQYLEERPTRFKLMATRRQDPMIVDGYSVLEMKSPIIGYSLFYYGDNGPLVIADAAVNPTHKAAVTAAAKLIAASLASVPNPDGSKMYFLGIYDLDSSRVLKIMVRAAQTPIGPDYAIRYAVSER